MNESLAAVSIGESQVKIQSEQEIKIETEIRQSWIDANVRRRENADEKRRKYWPKQLRRGNKIQPLYFGPKISTKRSKNRKCRKSQSAKNGAGDDGCCRIFARSLRLKFGGDDKLARFDSKKRKVLLLTTRQLFG